MGSKFKPWILRVIVYAGLGYSSVQSTCQACERPWVSAAPPANQVNAVQVTREFTSWRCTPVTIALTERMSKWFVSQTRRCKGWDWREGSTVKSPYYLCEEPDLGSNAHTTTVYGSISRGAGAHFQPLRAPNLHANTYAHTHTHMCTLKYFLGLFYFMCIIILSACLYLYCTCTGTQRSQKKALDSLELES